jgi:hypothetical protein
MKKIYILLIVIVFFFGGYLYINSSIGREDSFIQIIKLKIPKKLKTNLKETLFVFKNQELLKSELADREKEVLETIYMLSLPNKDKRDILHRLWSQVKKFEQTPDRYTKLGEILNKIGVIQFNQNKKIEEFKIENNNYLLRKFKTDVLLVGKNFSAIGSSYIEYDNNKLFLASATGIFGYVDINELNNKKFNMTIIPTNIGDLVNHKDFYYFSSFGIKDLLIHQNKIYVSYSNEIKKDCFNISILVSDLSLIGLKFEDFFTPKTCIDKYGKNITYEHHQSGGRMFPFKNEQILFSLGDHEFGHFAQEQSNLFGKIIAIDINTKKLKIISIGHRNAQGLYYDENENIIFSTEHGPQGGDEININILLDAKIKNYGWPVSSYGEHYGFTVRDDKHPKYIKEPLYKSHEDYGFIEPVKYFVPSIGISEIIKIPSNFNGISKIQYFVGSMGWDLKEGHNRAIHLFQFSEDYEILKHNVIPVNERIRDMIYVQEVNKVFLFFETTASIGILKAQN